VSDQLVSSFWTKAGEKEYVGVIALSGAIIYLDLAKPEAPAAIYHGVSSGPTAFALDRSRGFFYVATSDGNVTRFEAKTGLGVWVTGKGHEKNISGLAVAGDDLVSVGYDDKIRWNDIKSNAFSTDAVALGGQPNALAIGTKDSSLVVVSLAQDKIVLLRNKELKHTLSLGYTPLGVAVSNDDSEVAVAGKNSKVYTYSIKGDKFEQTGVLEGLGRGALAVHYNHTDNTIAAIDGERRLNFYQGGKSVNSHGWQYHSATVAASAFSPSGLRYATGSADETVLLWSDFKKWTGEGRVLIKDVHVQGVAFLGFWDENTLITVGSDRSIRIWKLPALSS
jgi:WD40 repeat protein